MGRKNRRNTYVAAREPNGRIQREERGPAPMEVRRLRDAALRGMKDPEWGTELGRLFLEGIITGSQYAAGKRWRASSARYLATLGVFPVRSLSGEPASRAEPPDPESDEGKKQVLRDEDAIESFMAAHAALISAGMGAESAVRRLCEEDLSLAGYYETRSARIGLSALADHYARLDDAKNAI